MKFHINDNGNVLPCRAAPGRCPLGGEHYATAEQARQAYETAQVKYLYASTIAYDDSLPDEASSYLFKSRNAPYLLRSECGPRSENQDRTNDFWLFNAEGDAVAFMGCRLRRETERTVIIIDNIEVRERHRERGLSKTLRQVVRESSCGKIEFEGIFTPLGFAAFNDDTDTPVKATRPRAQPSSFVANWDKQMPAWPTAGIDYSDR